jgi:menaquinone-dependent protoporphyrinogen oxidase
VKVLVTAASRHGATTAIAQVIADALTEARIDTVVVAPDKVRSLAGYDAVVIGSGIYVGKWLDSAREFIEREAAALVTRPVWLFSSGPVGDPPVPATEPDVAALIEATGARDHRVIPGKLDRSQLGFGEKAVTKLVRAAEGDFRPWSEVRSWAGEIARALQADPGGSGSTAQPLQGPDQKPRFSA